MKINTPFHKRALLLQICICCKGKSTLCMTNRIKLLTWGASSALLLNEAAESNMVDINCEGGSGVMCIIFSTAFCTSSIPYSLSVTSLLLILLVLLILVSSLTLSKLRWSNKHTSITFLVVTTLIGGKAIVVTEFTPSRGSCSKLNLYG